VTELNTATGAPVRVLHGPRYGFSHPVAIAADGARIWVANAPYSGGSVTELNAATGAPVRVLDGPSYGFDYPDAVAADGARIWVANANDDSVTEFPASPQ
jgi:DNA-binding beta-propeller fold protein YncE